MDFEQADEIGQQVMNVWATHVNSGKAALLTPKFMIVFHKMLVYKSARELAQRCRRSNLPSVSDAVNERVACEELCKAYKEFREEHLSFGC